MSIDSSELPSGASQIPRASVVLEHTRPSELKVSEVLCLLHPRRRRAARLTEGRSTPGHQAHGGAHPPIASQVVICGSLLARENPSYPGSPWGPGFLAL